MLQRLHKWGSFLRQTEPSKNVIVKHWICMTPDNGQPLHRLSFGLGSIWQCSECETKYIFVMSMMEGHGTWVPYQAKKRYRIDGDWTRKNRPQVVSL